MPSTIVNDFRLGVDRRRKRVSGPPGSLWTCINAHLTRGGDIEKRKKFVPKWDVPANTFGLKVSSAIGYVFGSDAPASVSFQSVFGTSDFITGTLPAYLAALQVTVGAYTGVYEKGWRVAPAGRVSPYFMFSAMTLASGQFTAAQIQDACAMAIDQMTVGRRQDSATYANPTLVCFASGKVFFANLGGTTDVAAPSDAAIATAGEFLVDGTVTWEYTGLAMPATWQWYPVEIEGDLFTKLSPDSNDSYAATLFSAALAGAVDAAWLNAASAHPGLSRIQVLALLASNCISDDIVNGLSSTFQSETAADGSAYTVQWLADNCEAWRGMTSLASLHTTVGDAGSAAAATAVAVTLKAGILALWDAGAGRFRSYYGETGVETQAGETDFVNRLRFHLWPLLHGVLSAGAETATYGQAVSDYVSAAVPTLYTGSYDTFVLSEYFFAVCDILDIEQGRATLLARSMARYDTGGITVVDAAVMLSAAASAPAPSDIIYQQLVSPSPAAVTPYMTALKDVSLFDGKLYAVAEFSDGNTHHFYDGEHVTAWDDGVVRSYTTSLDVIAARIAALINANASEVVSATVAGSVITLTGDVVDVSFTLTAEAIDGGTVDDQTAVAVTTTPAGGGSAQVSTVTLGGTLDVGDRFSVTIGVNQYGAGDNPATVATRLFTHGSKVYAMIGPTVYFCAVDDPTKWRANVLGAGFLNLSNNEEGTLNILGAARYQGDVAFFSTDSAQIWTLDADPANNALSRVIEQTGAVAGRTPFTYGNNDTFCLSRSGTRSMRSRDVSGAAFVTDIGNPIDKLVIDHMNTLGEAATSLAQSTMETIDGRYMLALGSLIYVLSYFPGSKIQGWTWYDPTEIDNFSADWVSVNKGKLYIRSGNTIYLYGGDDGNTYDSGVDDNYIVTVGLPFMGGKRLFEQKSLKGWDMAVENAWVVKALTDPRDENIKVTLGAVAEITYADMEYPASTDGEMFAMEMVCNTAGAASISNFALHFDE